MICPICKSNIRDDAVFCPVCGKPVPQDTPDIHKIETVELPKNKDTRITYSQGREESQAAVQRPSEKPVQYESSVQERPNLSQNESSDEKKAAYYGQEAMASGEHRQQINTSQSQQSRPYHQYRSNHPQGQQPRMQNTPPRTQSQAPRMQNPRPPVSNTGRAEPLSEQESLRLRNSLSKKAVLAFVFGIFGICSFSLNLPFAIVGLVMSIIVRNEYRDRNWPKDTDLKLSNAAFICSIIGIVLGVIGFIILITAGAGILAALSALSSMASGGGYYGF